MSQSRSRGLIEIKPVAQRIASVAGRWMIERNGSRIVLTVGAELNVGKGHLKGRNWRAQLGLSSMRLGCGVIWKENGSTCVGTSINPF